MQLSHNHKQNENMKTENFQKLIHAATARPLTIHGAGEEIPLDTVIRIHRPYGRNGAETCHSFDWKTPKKEDSILRSFLTAFFSKYREPDPEKYDRNCPCYGDTWIKYAEKWENPETHWNCALWGHHASNMIHKDKLKKQVEGNFTNFDSGLARLGFYETNYGIGLFTVYGGAWVRQALEDMGQHLAAREIPFRNELSEAGWVTRFVIGLDKPQHSAILGSF